VPRRKWVVAAVAGGAVLVVLLVGLAGHSSLPDVAVVRVGRQTLESWITTNGQVEPLAPVVLRARLDTFVQRVGVVEGQAVRRGQVLVELDVSAAAARLAEARQRLLVAQQQLRDAESGGPPDERARLLSDLEKARARRAQLAERQQALQHLVAQQAATREELAANRAQLTQADADVAYLEKRLAELARQARLAAEQARLRIQQAEADIRDLEPRVAEGRLLAPTDGVVYAVAVRPGQFVHTGDLLLEMADLHRVQVRAFVDEVDLGRVMRGQMVEIRWDGLPGHVWSGQVELVPKQVVPHQGRSVAEVLCSVDNADAQLLPNLNVDVRIRVARREGVLVVPRAAVQGEGADRFVFVVRGGRLEVRRVLLGVASATDYEVLGGLREGERVALPGSVELRDGLQVHPVEVQ